MALLSLRGRLCHDLRRACCRVSGGKIALQTQVIVMSGKLLSVLAALACLVVSVPLLSGDAVAASGKAPDGAVAPSAERVQPLAKGAAAP